MFYAGFDHISLPNEKTPMGGRLAYCHSADEGRTWTPSALLLDSPEDDRDISVTQLDGGRLIGAYFRYGKEKSSRLISSEDAGATWEEIHVLPQNYFVSSPVRQLSNGRLILGLYFAEEGRPSRGAIVTSDDRGATWNAIVDIGNPQVSLDAETDVIELSTGQLYAALRNTYGPMQESFSQDNGSTWSRPRPVNFFAHCPYLHRAPDGTVLLGYRMVTGEGMNVLKTGKWAPNASYRTAFRLSRNQCRSWSDRVLIDNTAGAYPSMVNLKDGSVLVVYYEEGAGSDIRAKRFRVTKDKVEFLPFDSPIR